MEADHVKIPLLQPFISRDSIRLVTETLNGTWVGHGPKTREFEVVVSSAIENHRFLALNSCTSALQLAYDVIGLSPGDEVITSPMTCLATNMPLLQFGAIPVWADIQSDGTISPNDVIRKLSRKTKAIVATDFAGHVSDLNALRRIANDADISLVEDAAHSFGAKLDGRPIGSQGDFVCFSFQSVKSITTVDGGGIAVQDDEVLERCRKKRWFGIDRLHREEGDANVSEIGYKFEMNDVAASIGLGNLQHQDKLLEHRRLIAKKYIELLSDCNDVKVVQPTIDGSDPTYWLFPILASNRDKLAKKLKEEGVETSPVHYRNDNVKVFNHCKPQLLPMVDRWAKEMTCLPIGHWVSIADVELIAESIKSGW